MDFYEAYQKRIAAMSTPENVQKWRDGQANWEERRERLRILYEAGTPLKVMRQQLGISQQRIYQMIAALNLPRRRLRKR